MELLALLQTEEKFKNDFFACAHSFTNDSMMGFQWETEKFLVFVFVFVE